MAAKMPITEILAKLEGLMLELFGVSKNHCIERNEKSQRGFSGRVHADTTLFVES